MFRVHVNFASDPNVIKTSINIRKIKLIAYIYIRFSLDEKSYITAEIEAEKHLQEVFLQRDVYFDFTDVTWLDGVIGIYVPMIFYKAFQSIHQEIECFPGGR